MTPPTLRKACSLLVLVTVLAGMPARAAEPGFVTMPAEAIEFRATGGDIEVAVLQGDPRSAGLYVMRVRFPPGVQSAPHHHDQDRHITVISGTWAFGIDASGDCSRTQPLGPGAYALHPAGAVHYDGACGDEAVVVQIIGAGPVQTFPIDPR